MSEEYPSLLRCPKIEEGIKACQAKGKTVLMSLGGASGAYGFKDEAQGEEVVLYVFTDNLIELVEKMTKTFTKLFLLSLIARIGKYN